LRVDLTLTLSNRVPRISRVIRLRAHWVNAFDAVERCRAAAMHGGDSLSVDCDIGDAGGSAGAIDQGGIANDEVVRAQGSVSRVMGWGAGNHKVATHSVNPAFSARDRMLTTTAFR
jgi:hypothetical protein